MSTLPRFGVTELVSGQAVPEVTVNENLRYVAQGAARFIFKDRDLTSPPGSPADGDCYLVDATATGAWAGQDGKIAFYMSTAWEFITPIEGFGAWVNDENVSIIYDGSAWVETGAGTLDELDDVNVAGALNGDVLTFNGTDWGAAAGGGGGGGGGGIDAGTSFPGSPATGDLFRRTDRNIIYFYDGTRWLSMQLFVCQADSYDAQRPRSSNGVLGRGFFPYAKTSVFIQDAWVNGFLAAAGSWSVTFTISGASTAIGTINSTSSQLHTVSINAVPADGRFDLNATLSSGGALYGVGGCTYRLIG